MLNVQHLLTFKALVRTNSFTETATELGLTQPAISQHIRKLEESVGGTLFQRHGRRVEITELGQILLEHVVNLERCHAKFLVTLDGYKQSQYQKRQAR